MEALINTGLKETGSHLVRCGKKNVFFKIPLERYDTNAGVPLMAFLISFGGASHSLINNKNQKNFNEIISLR